MQLEDYESLFPSIIPNFLQLKIIFYATNSFFPSHFKKLFIFLNHLSVIRSKDWFEKLLVFKTCFALPTLKRKPITWIIGLLSKAITRWQGHGLFLSSRISWEQTEKVRIQACLHVITGLLSKRANEFIEGLVPCSNQETSQITTPPCR